MSLSVSFLADALRMLSGPDFDHSDYFLLVMFVVMLLPLSILFAVAYPSTDFTVYQSLSLLLSAGSMASLVYIGHSQFEISKRDYSSPNFEFERLHLGKVDLDDEEKNYAHSGHKLVGTIDNVGPGNAQDVELERATIYTASDEEIEFDIDPPHYIEVGDGFGFVTGTFYDYKEGYSHRGTDIKDLVSIIIGLKTKRASIIPVQYTIDSDEFDERLSNLRDSSSSG